MDPGTFVVLAALHTLTPLLQNGAPCFGYDQFEAVVTANGGKVSRTIETAEFPDVQRIIVVDVAGTKELYMARTDCVMVPAMWVDYPAGMGNVTVIHWNIATPG